ncbi:phage tail protein [Gilliamella sp. WF3-4]|uniref:phage tail protein n=1 Tax=Gilliamella sp. WF3-4 TaxID=3120255 RepID=UPI003FA53242
MPWPQDRPPTGWFECNGASFDVNQFPKLASVFPWGRLPDLRGEFIRGWDNGRGVDSDRQMLSWQADAIRNITGEMSPISETFGAEHVATGAFQYFEKHAGHTPTTVDRGSVGGVVFDASRVVPTANENRPRNVAFMYIVKAE